MYVIYKHGLECIWLSITASLLDLFMITSTIGVTYCSSSLVAVRFLKRARWYVCMCYISMILNVFGSV